MPGAPINLELLMNVLTRMAVAVLGAVRWLLLAVAGGAVWLADLLKDAGDRLR